MSLNFDPSVHVINSPDVVAENFDGQIVILNLANGHYFSLGGIAGQIWPLIEGGVRLDSIVDSVAASRPHLAAGTVAFIGRLIELGLIRPQPSVPGADAPAGQEWPDDAPSLEAYEDLAELIFADPIHDVDEQMGWPAPRTTQ